MAPHTIVKKMLDAGVQFTEMSQSSAEKLVSEFVKAGQLRKKDAGKTVQELVDRGRSSTEQLLSVVQSEVAKQLARFADRVDGIEDRIEDLAKSVGAMAKRTAAPAPAAAAPAKKAPAKKSPAKKAPAKKSAAKKSAAKKAAGTSGVAKVVATRAAKR
ncbi:MAG: hypothetical protein AAB131_22280 [Actinomycetota bacterium]